MSVEDIDMIGCGRCSSHCASFSRLANENMFTRGSKLVPPLPSLATSSTPTPPMPPPPTQTASSSSLTLPVPLVDSSSTSIIETTTNHVPLETTNINTTTVEDGMILVKQNENIQTNNGKQKTKKKKTSDDEASTILLSLKTTNDNSEAGTTPDEASSSTSTLPKETTTSMLPQPPSSASLPSLNTTSSSLTPLSDTVLPAGPALAGAEVLDEAEYNRRMTMEYLRQYFHLPLNEVAQLWGVSKPAFKKLCRQHGIKRWPSRQVSSIISSITMLQNFCQENEIPEKILKDYESRLAVLHTSLEQIMQVTHSFLPPFTTLLI